MGIYRSREKVSTLVKNWLPPGAAGGNDAYTVSLLHMDGVDGSQVFTDDAIGGTHTWTANGNAQIDTAQYKFNGASGLFDYVGDYLSAPNSADFNMADGNFTIDAWVYKNGTGGTYYHIWENRLSDGAEGFALGVNDSNQVWMFYNNAFRIVTATAISAGWNHVALVRYGTLHTVYINGIADVNTWINASTYTSERGWVGGYYANTAIYGWLGWLDEFRLSKGIARWITNFTPPTSPYF